MAALILGLFTNSILRKMDTPSHKPNDHGVETLNSKDSEMALAGSRFRKAGTTCDGSRTVRCRSALPPGRPAPQHSLNADKRGAVLRAEENVVAGC